MRSIWQVLKKIGPLLFLISAAGIFFDQTLTQKMEALLMDPLGTSQWIWFYGLLSMLLSLIFPVLATVLTLAVLAHKDSLQFFKNKFPQLFKEQLRAWGHIMTWSLLLIIPGVVKFIQYLAVPFVITLDPQYSKGQRDALRGSRDLSKGKMLKLSAWSLLFIVVLPMALTSIDDYKSFSDTPVFALLICLLEMLLNLCFVVILWTIFRGSFDDEQQSDLSMERH
jgi:hypothetical protein